MSLAMVSISSWFRCHATRPDSLSRRSSTPVDRSANTESRGDVVKSVRIGAVGERSARSRSQPQFLRSMPLPKTPFVSACVAEFVGTFGLVFAGCGAIMINTSSRGQITHVGVGLVFGLIIAAMIYATGHLSGAHLNPAVTLGFVVARHFPLTRLAGYWLAHESCAVARTSPGQLDLVGPMDLRDGSICRSSRCRAALSLVARGQQ